MSFQIVLINANLTLSHFHKKKKGFRPLESSEDAAETTLRGVSALPGVSACRDSAVSLYHDSYVAQKRRSLERLHKQSINSLSAFVIAFDGSVPSAAFVCLLTQRQPVARRVVKGGRRHE